MNSSAASAPTSQPRLAAADFQYTGAFRVPQGKNGISSFQYAQFGLAYNAAHNSLFMAGAGMAVAEISIPAPSASATLGDLPTATLMSGFVDPSEGKSGQANCGGDAGLSLTPGGLLVANGKLYFDGYRYYDGSGCQTLSHFSRPLDLSVTGQVVGPAKLNSVSGMGAGVLSGAMGTIPPEWQSLLGGAAITSQCCIPIVSRTSWGPSFFAWNPSAMNISGTPTTPALFYDQSHPLATFEKQNSMFNGSSRMHGVVFPQGTRSVLYFMRQGIGPLCYGEVTNNPALAGQPIANGDIWCYDPWGGDKGYHAYPYVSQVEAFDANDLLAVKNGSSALYAPKPYAVFELPNNPYKCTTACDLNSADLLGAAYDPATGRIFVTQANVDSPTHDVPVVLVYKIGAGSAATQTLPAPTNLRIIP